MRIKPNGFWIAGLLVLLANGSICINVARNRTGAPVAEFELTDRELSLLPHGEDDSAVTLRLNYLNSAVHDLAHRPNRKTYLALEYDAAASRAQQKERAKAASNLDQTSNLVVIDVGPDAIELRRKYPDTRKVIILPGASKGTGKKTRAHLQVNTIHVPLPASRALKGASHYRVRLRQGPSLEIWVVEVQRIVG